jgi:hypothetical protein
MGMSLDTYANLQTAIANELGRTDLAAVVPDFITRFEAKARRELRDWLRFNVTLSNVQTDTVLPATVQEVLSVNYNDGTNGAHNFALAILSRDEYQSFMESESMLSSVAGQAVYPDVDQDANTVTLRFWPPAASTAPIMNLRVEAVKVLPGLSVTQTTNALLRDAPDVYLAGSCAEAAKYLAHDERIPVWEAVRDAGFKGLRILAERRAFAGRPTRRTLDRVFG